MNLLSRNKSKWKKRLAKVLGASEKSLFEIYQIKAQTKLKENKIKNKFYKIIKSRNVHKIYLSNKNFSKKHKISYNTMSQRSQVRPPETTKD